MPILPQCQGFCRDKTQCNRTLKEGRRYCQTHSSQESYSLKRKCLYATIAAKKQKTWKDGLYHWNHVNKQVQLYDERGIKIDEIFGQEPERSECYQLTRFELEVQLDSDEEDSGDDHSELAAQDGAQEGDAQLRSVLHRASSQSLFQPASVHKPLHEILSRRGGRQPLQHVRRGGGALATSRPQRSIVRQPSVRSQPPHARPRLQPFSTLDQDVCQARGQARAQSPIFSKDLSHQQDSSSWYQQSNMLANSETGTNTCNVDVDGDEDSPPTTLAEVAEACRVDAQAAQQRLKQAEDALLNAKELRSLGSRLNVRAQELEWAQQELRDSEEAYDVAVDGHNTVVRNILRANTSTGSGCYLFPQQRRVEIIPPDSS